MQFVKRVIACDIDGVLVDVVSAVINHVRAKFDQHLDLSKQTMYSLTQWVDQHETWDPGLRETIKKDVLDRVLHDPEWYWNAVAPYPGAKRAVAELCQNHTVIALTARPNSLRSVTYKMIARDFPGIQDIYHCGTQNGHADRGKAQKAKVLNAYCAIEDHPGTVAEYVKKKVYCFYVKRNYGGEIGIPTRGRVQVVDSINTAVAQIIALEKKSGSRCNYAENPQEHKT